MTDSVEKVSKMKLWNRKFETIESEQMEFWIDVARSTLALINVAGGPPSKSFFNSIDPKRTSASSRMLGLAATMPRP